MTQHLLRIILLASTSIVTVSNTVAIDRQAQDEAKLTPAYEVMVIYKSQVESNRRNLSATYKAGHPERIRIQDELDAIKDEMDSLARVEIPRIKMSSTLGRIVLRKALLRAELKTLRRSLTSTHPRVIGKYNQWASVVDEIDRILK